MKHLICHQKTRKNQAGFSLIELMIAMLLGLMVLAGSFKIYDSNKSSFRLQKAISQTQRNAQFSLGVISKKINSAGYSGFYMDLSSGVENLLNARTNQIWDISKPISGFNNVTNTTSIAGISGFLAGTDVLLLKEISQNMAINSQTDNKTIVIDDANNFTTADILLLTDTEQASIFQLGSLSTTAPNSTLTINVGTATTPGNNVFLDNTYGSNAEIGKLNVHMYYIKTGKNSRPALYEAIVNNTGTTLALQESELASNISNMQLVYGVDENNDKMVDEYLDASAVVTWSRVLSVGIVLLASSNENIAMPNATAYTFNTTDFNYQESTDDSLSKDKKFKRSFRSFSAIRNRSL